MPVLRVTLNGAEHATTELREKIAEALKLTPQDLEVKIPSGTQRLFVNRVAWAIVYLTRAGALKKTKRGVYQITDRGKDLLQKHPQNMNVHTLDEFPEFVAFHKGDASQASKLEVKIESTQTPEEQLAAAYQVLRDALANDVLESVKKAPPTFFETLVVDLLVAMGYGGSISDAGKAVGRSGDGGIDGTIKEDKLGLDVIYIQAKRWKDVVGRPVVQTFAGSLDGVKARKGVLITTSTFTQDALGYVEKIEKKIVLIDGKQLADLMIEYNIGVVPVQPPQTFTLKRLDSDYFEAI